MKLISIYDITGTYNILNTKIKQGIYQIDYNHYLFVINNNFIKLSYEEFNNIHKYYKTYIYNCYSINMFNSERFKSNYDYVKRCYLKFSHDRSNDIFNIKEFKRLIDILYNTTDFTKLLINIIWENNISRTVEVYIWECWKHEYCSYR